ncbi:hypothetical protein KBI52_22690 [Microvirga sp. HBU67558]|uniref:hypothetical protein n=1 Tax=Microvirga TaxID=186650 RepID=UPI001B36EC0C|nr:MULTISPECIES: hypothetical protein [unclassified Microvirga]MBQ0823001.1 hypothetical protein [Microvirga sp. HBU67558]
MLAKKKPSESRHRRVTRVEPPVLEEAIVAAQGLTDDIDSQVEIAAQLMGLPQEEVRPVVLKTPAQPRRHERMPERMIMPERSDGPKVVVVERKRPRLVMPR